MYYYHVMQLLGFSLTTVGGPSTTVVFSVFGKSWEVEKCFKYWLLLLAVILLSWNGVANGKNVVK